MIRKISFLVLVSTALSLISAIRLGNSGSEATFMFAIGPHALYLPSNRFFVAASQEVKDNDFAIAYANSFSTTMTGITPAEVMVNNVPKKPNPLRGAAIEYLALMGEWPIVVKQGIPDKLFLVDDARKQVFYSSSIKDGHGDKSQAVFAIETIAASVTTPLEATATMAAFAAVGKTEADNEVSVALALFKKFTPPAQQPKESEKSNNDTKKKNKASSDVKTDKKTDKDKDKKEEALQTPQQNFYAWDLVDATTGVHEFNQQGQPTGGGNLARLLTRDMPELKIQGALSVLNHAVDLHYDRDLARLYVALSVTSGPAPQDGARGVLVGSVSNGKLLFQEIASASVFADESGIVGTRGSLASVTIRKVRTMYSKMLLRYLIIVGGNGTDPILDQQVYALPLVDNLQSPYHGTLANVNSAPANLFDPTVPHRFLSRVLATRAVNPHDIYSEDSTQARVGGDGVLPGAITDIDVVNDAVMVSIAGSGNNLQPGIFSSQPIYDELGRIRGWTRWQRVSGANAPIVGFRFDPAQGVHWYIEQAMMQKESTTQSIFRTQWSNDKDSFSFFMATQFPPANGGVHGTFDFPLTTNGFTKKISERLSVMAFTGFEKVALVQTGSDVQASLFGPVTTLEPVFKSESGSLAGFENATTLVLSGGALAQLGPITSAVVVSDGKYGWFVVAGSGGVAVLAAPDGSGWDSVSGLGNGFAGLKGSMSWKLIRTTPYIHKLAARDNQLFVLSDMRLERMELSAALIASTQDIPTVTIAHLTDQQALQSSSYSDLIVSGPLGLLATSFGLLRTGNGKDIREVTSADDAQWTPVALPESAGSLCEPGPASRLFAVTPTLCDADLIDGGVLYVLNGYVGLDAAQGYRFAVVNQMGQVTDQTVQLLPDYFIEGRKTFFVNPGEYRNYIVTDGAVLALSRSSFGGRSPFLELVSGVRGRIPWLRIPEAHSMGKLIRNSASGAWVASGDFGVRLLA